MKTLFSHFFKTQTKAQSLLRNATQIDYYLDPTPHLCIKNALDPKYYQLLSDHYPHEDWIRASKHVANRDQMIASDVLSHPNVHQVWKDFTNYHTSISFFKEILHYFADDIRKIYPSIEQTLNAPLEKWQSTLRDPLLIQNTELGMDCQPGLNVRHDTKMSVRSAHLDASNKLITGLFYMKYPEDTSHGGDFTWYKPNQIPCAFDTPSTVLESQLQVLKTIPYSANTAIFFLNTPWAIHGVTEREVSTHPRRLVNLVMGCYQKRDFSLFNMPPTPEDFSRCTIHQ
jgi:hypothetical protein